MFQCDNDGFNIALRQGENAIVFQLMSQCDNVANDVTMYWFCNVTNVGFNIALGQGENATIFQLMSQLMSQCGNVANNVTLYGCWK